MNTCIICSRPAPNGLCPSCVKELFKGEPVRVKEKRRPRPVLGELFFSSLEDRDSAGYPENYF